MEQKIFVEIDGTLDYSEKLTVQYREGLLWFDKLPKYYFDVFLENSFPFLDYPKGV